MKWDSVFVKRFVTQINDFLAESHGLNGDDHRQIDLETKTARVYWVVFVLFC